ncbi:MAG: hypothetical protein BWY36_00431 [Candidatus Diapherotrites archaeon ADurb.Bin253]|jgi:hypothetical protein|nr:hypothetical protein [Candidatus Pacearchaeota archaeon]OQA68348.1 MAG: hypothetical protein BWY36_00431 [Candidatus Diapherotrites archaeon ADurb.Bin253]HNZ52073.1 hypothetical protein [Candidatus Pacearchaeota archaeon]HOU79603.1 hypothetical protein [Candidatus Pacearchaeota archaeon]HPX74610.1 hypothetical protein [Candidatus Pacearchaeota archaeon]
MKLEEFEALDLKLGQRIELTLNTSIGPDKHPLPDNETYTQMVYYKGIVESEHGTPILLYTEATPGISSINNQLGLREAIEGHKMLPLIHKISYLELM